MTGSLMVLMEHGPGQVHKGAEWRGAACLNKNVREIHVAILDVPRHRDFGPYPAVVATGSMGIQPKGRPSKDVGANRPGGTPQGEALRDSGASANRRANDKQRRS